jgi:hypothetical protein
MEEETVNNFNLTPDAIAWIKENPKHFGQFDAEWGDGAAASINGEPDDGVLEDMGKGLVEGALGLVRETGQFIGDVDDAASGFMDKYLGGSTIYRDKTSPIGVNFGTQEDADIALQEQGFDGAKDLQELAAKATMFGSKRDTGIGGATQGITQFIAGLVGVGKLTKLKTLSTVKGGLIGGAIVDGVAFDPDDANLVRLLDEQFGIGNDVLTEVLANDEESQWINRLKNAGTGTLIGGTLDSVIVGVRFLKAKKKAEQEIQASGEISKETIEEVRVLEEQIKKFEDLADKPKGQMIDGKFHTDDGMVFNPQTGAREFEVELNLKKPTAKVEAPEAPTAPKAQDGKAIEPEVVQAPKAPKEPKLPSSVVNIKAFKDAAVRSRAINEVVQIGDLDQMGNNLGLFNYEKFDGSIDAVKVMDQMQDALDESGVLKTMGIGEVQSLDEVKKLAMRELQDITDDPKAVSLHFAKLEEAGRDAGPRIVAGKMALQSTGRKISELVDEIDNLTKTNNVDTRTERKLVNILELHADLQASVKGMQTSAARAVGAGRIRTGDVLDDVALDRLTQYGGSKKVRALAEKLKGAQGNPAAMSKLIRKAQKRTFMGVINEVWLNAILSGPRTHAMNIGSNSINLAMRPAQRMVGGTWGVISPNPKVKMADRMQSVQQVEVGARQYFELMSELGDSMLYLGSLTKMGKESAMATAFKSFYREEGVLDTASKFDFNQVGNSRQIGGVTGKLVRGAGRTLMAEDEFFKQLVFRSKLKSMVKANSHRLSGEQLTEMGFQQNTLASQRKAYIEETISGAQLTKENLAQKWEEMVFLGQVADDARARDMFIENNIGTYNHNSSVAKQALEEAREATFTTPLREGTLGKNVQDALNTHQWLRQIMPFIQTPTNILRVSFERVPALGLFAGRQLKLLREGTPDQKAMVIGQQAVGVATTALALDMAFQGRITGGGPTYTRELDKAKLWNASPDWMPYSVNIGTSEEPQWVELKKLDPHGMIFGIVGDISEMIEYTAEDPDPELSELLAMVSASVANNVMSKTYLKSLNETMNLMSGSAKPWEMRAFFENRTASMIPYSGLMYQANQMGDDHMRDLRSLTDKVKARVYGQNTAAVKHDWLTGEAVDTPDYMRGFIRQKKVDSGEHKASKVYEELRKLNHGFAGPQRKLGVIELAPEVFQRYNELVGNIRLYNKRTLIEELDRRIQTKQYSKLTNEAELFPVESSLDPRVKAINKVIEDYKEAARKMLFKEFPELGRANFNNKKIMKSIKNGGDPQNADNIVREFSITE